MDNENIQQEAEARATMETMFNISVAQIQPVFFQSVTQWINNHLNLHTVNEILNLHSAVIDALTEEYRNEICPSLWEEFVQLVDIHGKNEVHLPLFLENIHKTVSIFNEGIKRQFELYGYFPREDDFNQMVMGEFSKLELGCDEKVSEMVTMACDKLTQIYQESNEIILKYEAGIISKNMTSARLVYIEQMKRYLQNVPYSHLKLKEIHLELVEKLVDAVGSACSMQENNNSILTIKLAALRNDFGVAFECYKEKNVNKLVELQAEVSKIIQTLKDDHNEKVELILKKNVDGLDTTVLSKFHDEIKVETMKLLEMEIKLKISPHEPLENHKDNMQAHIDNYYKTVVVAKNMDNLNVKLQKLQEETNKITQTIQRQHHEEERRQRGEATRRQQDEERRQREEAELKRQEEEQRKKETEARSVMEEVFNTAVSQVQRAFYHCVPYWIKNRLNLNTVNEFLTIHAIIIKDVTEEHRNVISPSLWNEFVRRVDTHSKNEFHLYSKLDKIQAAVTQFNRGVNKQFDLHCFFAVEEKFSQMIMDELSKVEMGNEGDEFIAEKVTMACYKLSRIYGEHNRYIMECEDQVISMAMTQVKSVYHEQMRRYVVDAPYSPQKLQCINSKLVEKLVDAVKNACSRPTSTDDTLATKLASMKKDFDNEFGIYKLKNRTSLQKLHVGAIKINQNLRIQYKRKVDEMLKKNSQGLDSKVLGKLHDQIKVEAMKLLEMEIKAKIGREEPLENYNMTMQAYIESYWRSVVVIENVKNISRKKEREEQERRRGETHHRQRQ